METSYSELRTKEVVNTTDGRRLGKVCDVVFCYPENRVLGLVVPGGKGWSLWKSEQFIEMRHIVKIGDDVILVNFNMPPKPNGRRSVRKPAGPCGPSGGYNPPPPAPQPYCGEPRAFAAGTPDARYADRRSYEEYE